MEDQIRRTEKLLEASILLDDSHEARRLYATLVGIPLGVAAFLFIGIFWNAANGTGVYVGIVCAFILWIIARHILSLPVTETPTIGLQIKKLEKERVRLQESLKKHIGQEDAEAPDEASQDTVAAS